MLDKGLGQEKLGEIVSRMHSKKLYAVGVAETWRLWREGTENLELDGVTIVENGGDGDVNEVGGKKKDPMCRGVAIFLSQEAGRDWIAAGGQVERGGARIIALHLVRKDRAGRQIKTFLVVAYAPTSAGSSDSERKVFFEDLARILEGCGRDEILLMGGDFNAKLGIGDKGVEGGRDRVLGPNGLLGPEGKANKWGKEFHSFLAARNLCSTTSFFLARNGKYATHDSNLPAVGSICIDYWICRVRDLKRVLNAQVSTHLSVNSDHYAIKLSIRSLRFIRRRKARKKAGQIVDSKPLRNRDIAATFKEVLSEELEKLGEKPDNLDSLEYLEQVVNAAAKKVLSRDRDSSKGWYEDRIAIFEPLTRLRNTLQLELSKYPLARAKTKECTTLRQKLRTVKKKIESAVKQAKRDWLEEIIGRMNYIISGGFEAQQNSAHAWQAVKELVQGLDSAIPVKALNLLKKNGEKCKNADETIKVVIDQFSSIEAGEFDDSVLTDAPDHETKESLGVLPKYPEIRRAVYKMKSGKSPGESGIAAEYYKVLMKEDDDQAELLVKVIQNYWRGTETYSSRFNVSLLKLVFKKGNRGLAENWRPISLLDVAAKIVSSIIATRLQALLKDLGYKTQFGFTEDLGTTDAIFSLTTALRKRMEMELTSYVLYVDLVKAFDTIERTGLFKILKKFGLPASLLTIIERMHSDTSVKFVYKGKSGSYDSSSGVKQGCPLAPVLFLFVMQFAMESLERSPEWQLLRRAQFATRHDGTLAGRDLTQLVETTASKARWEARERGTNRVIVDPEVKGDHDVSAFEFLVSLYADDGAFLFTFRKDLEKGTNILVKHFRRFGMQMHFGTGDKKSKTEFTCFSNGTNNPFAGQSCKPVSIFDNADGIQVKIGEVTHVDAFVYLGSAVSNDLDDLTGITRRIDQAQGMFNKLEKCFFKSRDYPLVLKSRIYSALILSVLLYGSESWCTTGKHLAPLKSFHHRCVRIMCRTSLFAHQKTSNLLKKLKLSSMDSLIASRSLNWLGHVARMAESAVPRMLLTSFVTHEQDMAAGKFKPPYTSTPSNKALKRNGRFKRTYSNNVGQWLKRASEHPEFEEARFDDDPDTNLVLGGLLNKGLSCFSVRESEEQPSWYTLARDRVAWNEVCLFADYELLGPARVTKRIKKEAKNRAKISSLNADAAIWQLY
jgi:hypothetical protein